MVLVTGTDLSVYLTEATELWGGALLLGASQLQQLIFPTIALSWKKKKKNLVETAISTQQDII